MNIRVRDILNLMFGCTIIHIWVDGDTYEFPVYELPREVKDMIVDTIDDPYNCPQASPLCLNLSTTSNFDDYEEFKDNNKEYLI